ncbi:MAG: ParA family protein [Deltaproteobacteria bacterium]|nr:MAG: ParA family protein [Deltaproteobacteria bacterium]
MSVPTIAFFGNKGVGKTFLVYHLAWMYIDLGMRVAVTDLDPQANLTAAFLSDERLERLWPDGEHPLTIFGCVRPLKRGIGDIAGPHLEYIKMTPEETELFPTNEEPTPLALLPGDMLLLEFEEQLSEVWPKCMGDDEHAFRVTSAFWRIMQNAAHAHQADLILTDLGPNLGAINRSALIAADYVVVPLVPDIFALQGLRYLGSARRRWQTQWNERLRHNPAKDSELPSGAMHPLGYIVLQHAERLYRPAKVFQRQIARIPEAYRTYFLDEIGNSDISVRDDPLCLSFLRNYVSLMPLAYEARKPIFHLKPADGAIGAYFRAVQQSCKDFKQLALKIAEKASMPPSARIRKDLLSNSESGILSYTQSV